MAFEYRQIDLETTAVNRGDRVLVVVDTALVISERLGLLVGALAECIR